MAQKADRDIEKSYSKSEFVAKLRRLADAIENDERFEIQIANERIYVPKRAIYNIEHEREDGEEEIEFQIKWSQEE
ncbi:MAG: amphi-Trp domain-containing protein [Bacteroidota bacterium]